MGTSASPHARRRTGVLVLALVCATLLVSHVPASADYVIAPTNGTSVSFSHEIALPTATVNLPLTAPEIIICNPDCKTYGGEDLSSTTLSADQGPYRLVMSVAKASGSYLQYANVCPAGKVGALLTVEGMSSATSVLAKVQQASRNEDGTVMTDPSGKTVFEDIPGAVVDRPGSDTGPIDVTTGLCLGGVG